MSKKKNKKKNSRKSYYDFTGKKANKKEKDTKKSKGDYYEPPKLKCVKASLDKKDAKESKKILTAPVDIPKDFIKNRVKCNHAGKIISVAEFKELTPTYAAFTPMLDTIIQIFGEEKVSICKGCYDVLVSTDAVSSDDMIKALAILYAGSNILVSNKRMKDDEVKDINKAKLELGDWNKVIGEFRELEESGVLTDSQVPANATASTLSSADVAKLNRTAGTFVQ